MYESNECIKSCIAIAFILFIRVYTQNETSAGDSPYDDLPSFTNGKEPIEKQLDNKANIIDNPHNQHYSVLRSNWFVIEKLVI